MLFPQKINVVASARHANPHNETVVVQNDTAVEFYVAVVGDNGQTELPEGATYTLVCLHLRKQPTEKLGTLQEDGNVMFKLTHMELSETGPIQAQVRVYHPVGGRLTSDPFIFHVAPDPTYGAEIKPEDQSIIEQVIGEGPGIIAEAKKETELNITERARLTGAVGGALNSLADDKAQALLEMSQSKATADESAQTALQAADNADQERERLTQEVSDKLTEVETARSATEEATSEARSAAQLAIDEADAARLQKEEVEEVLGAGPVASVNGQTGIVSGLATQESVNQVAGQLADKAEKAIVDSLSINKRDKSTKISSSDLDTSSDANKVKLVNLADEVQQALTGNAPAMSVIPTGSVTTEKIAVESVITNRRTVNGEMAMIFGLAPVEFNLITKQAIFSPTGVNHRIFYRHTFYTIPSNTIVDITPSGSISGKLYFNWKSLQFKVYRWDDTNYKEDEFLIASYTLANGTNKGNASIYGSFNVVNLSDPVEPEETTDIANLPQPANLEDMINSWWMHPLAIRYKGVRDNTYLGYTDSKGGSGVASVNNETGAIARRVLKKGEADDHNAVSVSVMGDRKLIAAYSNHNKDQILRVRISKRPENIEEWEEEIQIPVPNTTSYAQVFYIQNKTRIFFRVSDFEWYYVDSSDGVNWGTPKSFLISANQYYVKASETLTSNILRLTMYGNPTSADTDIRVALFNTISGDLMTLDSVVIGNMYSLTSPIPKESFDIIVPKGATNQRLLDVSINVPSTKQFAIAYATFTNATDVQYKVAYYNNGTLTVVDVAPGGGVFYTGSNYVGGIVFDKTDMNRVYLSRKEGAIWYVEKWQRTNGVDFEKIETLDQSRSGYIAVRPVYVTNGEGQVFWQKGYYNPNSYKNFLTDYHTNFNDIP